MKIVIDIPKQAYEAIKRNDVGAHAHNLALLTKWIADGTPILEGHGVLKDADRIKAEVFKASMDSHFMPVNLLTCDTVTEIIDNAPTIIEAGKEGAKE